MSQLHDTGEEYIIKNTIEDTFGVGLYNTDDNLSDSDDLSNITTEPSTPNYARVTGIPFSAEDRVTNWEINNDSSVTVDVSADSSTLPPNNYLDESVDGYFIFKNFQSEDKGDGSPQDHLIATGDLPREVTIWNGLTHIQDITLRRGHAGISLDDTQIFDGFEDGSVGSKFPTTNSTSVSSSQAFEGTYSLESDGNQLKFWEWQFLGGSSGEVQRFRGYYWTTNSGGNAGGSGINFQDTNDNVIAQVAFTDPIDNENDIRFVAADDNQVTNLGKVGWFGLEQWVQIIVEFNYIDNTFTVDWRDTESTQVANVVERPMINSAPLREIEGIGWDTQDEQPGQNDSFAAWDNLEVRLS